MVTTLCVSIRPIAYLPKKYGTFQESPRSRRPKNHLNMTQLRPKHTGIIASKNENRKNQASSSFWALRAYCQHLNRDDQRPNLHLCICSLRNVLQCDGRAQTHSSGDALFIVNKARQRSLSPTARMVARAEIDNRAASVSLFNSSSTHKVSPPCRLAGKYCLKLGISEREQPAVFGGASGIGLSDM